MSRPKRVIIIGGGLAGIAASVDLIDRGFETILLERRDYLGGRATSFHDPASDSLLDNCQHVLLGCCTELKTLYARLGVADRIAFFDTIHFADQTGKRSNLRASNFLPHPIHLGPAMLGFGLLTLPQKLEIARAMAAMMRIDNQQRHALDAITFAQWLLDHDQSSSTIDRFWNVIITSALNEDAHIASAKYAIQVFQESFLRSRTGYEMGLPTVPLAEIYSKAPATKLRTGARVNTILIDNAHAHGVGLGNGERIEANHIILATAPEAARRILIDSQIPLSDLIDSLGRLAPSPIIGAHFWYDRRVMDLPHLALIGTTLQWLFRKDADGRHLHGVISAANALVDQSPDELTAQFDAEIRTLLPMSRDAKLIRTRIIKERRATFSPRPGTDLLRPNQLTSIPGLYLAGDYTQTNWPATMEGAVISGRLAAAVVGL